jgi:tetratricopeptide (TPR) repeat protein
MGIKIIKKNLKKQYQSRLKKYSPLPLTGNATSSEIEIPCNEHSSTTEESDELGLMTIDSYTTLTHAYTSGTIQHHDLCLYALEESYVFNAYGRYDESEKTLRHAFNLYPEQKDLHSALLGALMAQCKVKEFIEEIIKYQDWYPRNEKRTENLWKWGQQMMPTHSLFSQ